MTDDPAGRMRSAAEDKAWLDSLSKADRNAEMERRKALFAQQHGKLNISGPKNFKERAIANLKTWAIVIAVLVAGYFLLNLFFGGTTGVERLDVGDCFMFPDEEDQSVERLDTPDCTEPHEGQIFHRFSGSASLTEPDAGCFSNIDRISTEARDALGDSFDISVGSFSVTDEDTGAVTSILCWVGFEPMNSTSVVDVE